MRGVFGNIGVKLSVPILLFGSLYSPINVMAQAHKLKVGGTVAVNGQSLIKAYALISLVDPNTKKLTAYMPVWYALYLLKPYGLTYSWNSESNELHLYTKSSVKNPTKIRDNGDLSTFINNVVNLNIK